MLVQRKKVAINCIIVVVPVIASWTLDNGCVGWAVILGDEAFLTALLTKESRTLVTRA